MNEKWIVLTYAKSEVEGWIIKGKLETEGIPAIIQQEAIGKIYRITIDGLGEIKVLVPISFLKQAKEILNITKYC